MPWTRRRGSPSGAPATATSAHGAREPREWEREVLNLASEGLSNAEIGERLSIAEKTVRHNMTAMLTTLGARSRVEAALIGYRSGPGRG